MKKLLLLTITLFTLGANAQTSVYHPFPDSDAAWNIRLHPGLLGCGDSPVFVIYSYIFSGDTAINSATYHKLFRPFVMETDTCHFGLMLTGYSGCIRQDITAKKVYYVPPDSASEDLLYDFNMQVGDTVRGYIENYAFDKDIVYTIDSVFVGSSYRKRWNMENGYNLSFIEGLGSTYGLIGQSLGQFVGDGANYYITCFQQNGQTLFPDTATNCTIITSLTSIDKSVNEINVFPNPSNGSFTVDLDKPDIKEIRLTDMLGNLIFRQQSDIQSKIKIDNLSSGTFILTIVDKNDYATNRKIISCP